jgi:diphosphomevalonate decarboxylase
MSTFTATAVAHPNIAFIKYWGNRDPVLRIPENGSISMNLAGLVTRTSVTFKPDLENDELLLAGKPASDAALQRVKTFLSRVREMASVPYHARVESFNNFPTGAGIASSASAFAALSLAASKAAGLDLTEPELSRLARIGSGSACRSIPGGFVEWKAGQDDASSYAFSIASPSHWDLVDCVAIVSQAHKVTGSTEGHQLARSSPLQECRLADVERRLDQCRASICDRHLHLLAEVVEQDSNMMHAVMLTSCPSLIYWEPATLEIMKKVIRWRREGLPVFYTIDAGPNVHVLCLSEALQKVRRLLENLSGVQRVITAEPGGPASLVQSNG